MFYKFGTTCNSVCAVSVCYFPSFTFSLPSLTPPNQETVSDRVLAPVVIADEFYTKATMKMRRFPRARGDRKKADSSNFALKVKRWLLSSAEGRAVWAADPSAMVSLLSFWKLCRVQMLAESGSIVSNNLQVSSKLVTGLGKIGAFL